MINPSNASGMHLVGPDPVSHQRSEGKKGKHCTCPGCMIAFDSINHLVDVSYCSSGITAGFFLLLRLLYI